MIRSYLAGDVEENDKRRTDACPPFKKSTINLVQKLHLGGRAGGSGLLGLLGLGCLRGDRGRAVKGKHRHGTEEQGHTEREGHDFLHCVLIS